jgi:HPt (histidine-containing phosphotransfer) domain-containing protein
VPGLDAAASAALAEAFLAEIRAARTALAEATEPAGMVAAAHRLAGAAATLSLGPLADAARGFQRGARELAAAERTARRDALLALAEATLRAQAPTS